MAKKRLFPIAILMALVVGSCGLEDAFAPHLSVRGDSGVSYIESKTSWQKQKQENGDSYEYALEVTSFTGHGNRTIMSIENGKVMKRTYLTVYMDPDNGEVEEQEVYSESGLEVGTNSEGAKPLTIDALYEICASEYLVVDEENNRIYFDTNDEEIMDLCGYVPIGCADDCFTGLTFSHFAWK